MSGVTVGSKQDFHRRINAEASCRNATLPTVPIVHAQSKQVVLVGADIGNAYGRGALLGVAHHARECGTWSLVHAGLHAPLVEMARAPGVRGGIAQIDGPRMIGRIHELNVPTINVSSRVLDQPLPVVASDPLRVAALTVDHFMERGFDHIAFVGIAGDGYSTLRQNALCAALSQRQLPCLEHNFRQPYSERSLKSWLTQAPKPLGVLAANDNTAATVINLCLRIGVECPRQVAVLGVDNDEVICETSPVPISSIDNDAFKIGAEAARLLQRMFDGEAPPAMTTVMARGLVARSSTATHAFNDPVVAEALRYLQAQEAKPVRVKEILLHLGISRRSLERHFLASMGRRPHEEIMRRRVARATMLLERTDLAVADVASQSGFSDVRLLNAQLRRALQMTPGQYRRKSRS